MAAVALQRVGLQLVLEPQSSSLIFAGGSQIAGVVYPVYATFKALRTQDLPASERWLTYWAIYGVFSLLERVADKALKWLPYYSHLKFGFLLWLQLPQTQGAKYIYQKVLEPHLRRYERKVDICLQRSSEFMASAYSMYKVPVQQAVAASMLAFRQVQQFIEWLSTPEDTDSDINRSTKPPNGSSTRGRASAGLSSLVG